MLVFMSPSWERKPAEKRDEGEAQAGVRVSSHGPAHDQMKERYLFWHHTGGGRAAPESAVGVSGIEEECRWGGLDTYLHVYQLAQVQNPELWGVLLCGVMIKEFNVGQSASWQAVSHLSLDPPKDATKGPPVEFVFKRNGGALQEPKLRVWSGKRNMSVYLWFGALKMLCVNRLSFRVTLQQEKYKKIPYLKWSVDNKAPRAAQDTSTVLFRSHSLSFWYSEFAP